MNAVFITRAKAENKNDLDKQRDLQDLIRAVQTYAEVFSTIYIVSNFEDKIIKPVKNSIPIIVVKDKDDDPTSPISLNTVLERIRKKNQKLDGFLICSQEVELTKDHMKALISQLEKYQKRLLVVGYRFKINNDFLDNELQNYYTNKNLIAYKVPWNTCALWNYELFDRYVIKFDEITNRNFFNPVCVSIDGVCSQTKHRGMEDGLAIAQAVSQERGLKYKLIKRINLPLWKVKSDKKQDHKEKLARKDTVLRNFMAVRNYSVRNLEAAEMKYKYS